MEHSTVSNSSVYGSRFIKSSIIGTHWKNNEFKSNKFSSCDTDYVIYEQTHNDGEGEITKDRVRKIFNGASIDKIKLIKLKDVKPVHEEIKFIGPINQPVTEIRHSDEIEIVEPVEEIRLIGPTPEMLKLLERQLSPTN